MLNNQPNPSSLCFSSSIFQLPLGVIVSFIGISLLLIKCISGAACAFDGNAGDQDLVDVKKNLSFVYISV